MKTKKKTPKVNNENAIPSSGIKKKKIPILQRKKLNKLKNNPNGRLNNNKKKFDDIRKKLEFRFLPWAHVNELVEVRDCIYSGFHFQNVTNLDLEDAVQRIFVPNQDQLNRLYFARDKLSLWKYRCRNIEKSQLIVCHLNAIESMLNILIEEYNVYVIQNGCSNTSLLYSLYCELF